MSQTVESSSANPYEIPPTRWTVKELPKRMQPREEVERLGVRYVSDATLLAILLRSGTRGQNVVELADVLLRKYGSLTALSTTSIQELTRDEQVKGLGKVKAQVLLAALEVGRRLQQEAIPERTRICTPEDAVRILAADVAGQRASRFAGDGQPYDPNRPLRQTVRPPLGQLAGDAGGRCQWPIVNFQWRTAGGNSGHGACRSQLRSV